MRIMGLDYGSKTVGVAVSDSLLITAQGIEIVRRERADKHRGTLARLEEIIRENEVSLIVLGLPKNMDGSIGTRAELTLEFAEILRKKTGLEVVMWDERLTTVAAHRAMSETGIKGKERNNYVDSMAASLILQGYLDYRKISSDAGREAGGNE